MPNGNVFFTACVGAFGSSLMSWQLDNRRNASTRSIIEPVEMGDWREQADVTSLRLPFAFLGVGECYGDLTTTKGKHSCLPRASRRNLEPIYHTSGDSHAVCLEKHCRAWWVCVEPVYLHRTHRELPSNLHIEAASCQHCEGAQRVAISSESLVVSTKQRLSEWSEPFVFPRRKNGTKCVCVISHAERLGGGRVVSCVCSPKICFESNTAAEVIGETRIPTVTAESFCSDAIAQIRVLISAKDFRFVVRLRPSSNTPQRYKQNPPPASPHGYLSE